jgi:hypothetical protein
MLCYVDFFLQGEAIVPVANCGQEQFSSHPKKDMLLSEYLDYWENYRSEGYPGNQPCLYLKDWHFTKYVQRMYIILI